MQVYTTPDTRSNVHPRDGTAISRRRAAIVATRKLLEAIENERAELDRREAAALERLKNLESN